MIEMKFENDLNFISIFDRVNSEVGSGDFYLK